MLLNFDGRKRWNVVLTNQRNKNHDQKQALQIHGQRCHQKQIAFFKPAQATDHRHENAQTQFTQNAPKNRLKKKKSELHDAIYKESP